MLVVMFSFSWCNVTLTCIITARSELRKVLFLAPSDCDFLFVCEISWESLPNSHGRRVWSLAGTSLKVKVKVTRDKNGIFGPFGGLRAVYVW